jgi:DNA-binding PadR family transcriptional regulator
MQVEAPALKGLFNMLLLSILADRPLHAYALIDALEQAGRGQFHFSAQAVYPALHRLEHLGVVSSSLSAFSGRTRRTYSITPQGRDQLTADWKAWEEFTAAIAALIDSRRAGDH